MQISPELIAAEIDQRALDFTQDAVLSLGGNAPAILEETGIRRWAKCGRGKVSYTTTSGHYPDGKYFRRVTVSDFKTPLSFNSNKIYDDVVKDLRAGKQRSYARPAAPNTPPPVDKAKLFEAALAADQALWNDGVEKLPYQHPYFAKKGLLNIKDPAIRYVQKDASRYSAFPTIEIMAKIIDIDGNLRGFQRIDEQGKKLLTQGMSKQGAFIVLGSNLPVKPKHIKPYLCEGLATGLTTRMLTDYKIPVVVCIDAGNILPVVQELRAQYGTQSKCTLTIVADNDWQKASKLNPQGQPIGNTGLKAANFAAEKYNCKVVEPNFDGISPIEGQSLSDINDLFLAKGKEEALLQLGLVTKADYNYILNEKILENVRQDRSQQFNGIATIPIKDRYLPNQFPFEGDLYTTSELLEQKRCVLVKSAIGTGKSEMINQVIKANPNKRILVISPLASLGTTSANRFKIENYQQYSGDIEGINEVQRLSICADSLINLINEKQHLFRHWDIIVFDEIEFILQRLTQKMDDKLDVLLAIKALAQQPDARLMILDANLSPNSIQLLKSWLPNDQLLAIHNTYEVGQGKELIYYAKEASVLKGAIEALKNEKKEKNVFIVTNSRRGARKLYLELGNHTDREGLYIAADNNGDQRVIDLLANPNKEAVKYAYIVCSPSVTSGLSIDVDHFDYVAGIFTHTINTPNEAMQALGRVRKAKKLHVYISDVKTPNLPIDDKEIAAKWTSTHKWDENLVPFSDIANGGERATALQAAQLEYAQIVLGVTKQANVARRDYAYNFFLLAKLDGYKLIPSKKEMGDKAAKELMVEAHKAEDEDYISKTVNAPVLPNDELQHLKDEPRRDLSDNRIVGRANIVDFYAIPPDTPKETIEQVVVEDKRGKLQTKVRNLELALSSDEQIQEMREAEIIAGKTLLPDQTPFAVRRELLRKILTEVGIDADLRLNENTTYNKESLSKNIVPFLTEHYLDLKSALKSMPPLSSLEDSPTKSIGVILGRMGLTHTRTGDHKEGKYKVETDSLEKMRKLLLKRGKVILTTEPQPKPPDTDQTTGKKQKPQAAPEPGHRRPPMETLRERLAALNISYQTDEQTGNILAFSCPNKDALHLRAKVLVTQYEDGKLASFYCQGITGDEPVRSCNHMDIIKALGLKRGEI